MIFFFSILRKPEDLKTNLLPTAKELLKYYLQLKHESNTKKPKGFLSKLVNTKIQILETSCTSIRSKPRVIESLKKILSNYAD